jgi:hypothetical protein
LSDAFICDDSNVWISEKEIGDLIENYFDDCLDFLSMSKKHTVFRELQIDINNRVDFLVIDRGKKILTIIETKITCTPYCLAQMRRYELAVANFAKNQMPEFESFKINKLIISRYYDTSCKSLFELRHKSDPRFARFFMPSGQNHFYIEEI